MSRSSSVSSTKSRSSSSSSGASYISSDISSTPAMSWSLSSSVASTVYSTSPEMDIRFKCDLPGCSNEYSDQFWVECIICEREFHTGCADLPNKDYKSIRCKPCHDYMKGLGPEVAKKKPVVDQIGRCKKRLGRKRSSVFRPPGQSSSSPNYQRRSISSCSSDFSSEVSEPDEVISFNDSLLNVSELNQSSASECPTDLSETTDGSLLTETTSCDSTTCLVSLCRITTDSDCLSNSTSSFELLDFDDCDVLAVS